MDLVYESGAVDMLGLITADWNKLIRWRTDAAALSIADFDRVRRSGVTTFHPAVHLPSKDPRGSTERWLRGWLQVASFHPEKFHVLRAAPDLSSVPLDGRIELLLGAQNSTHFSTVSDVPYFASIGQRVSQLTYNGRNRIGYGCHAGQDRGLTGFGHDIIAEMNCSGMVVDASHSGPRTALDASTASVSPVIISHTNCRALTPREPRCVSDDVIRKIAARGGVIGLTAIRKFVGRSSLDGLLDHFDHVVELVGPEFVGIGSDADLEGRQPVIRELANADFMFAITEGLLRRGYGEAEVRAILGGNFRRVLRAVLPST